LLKQLIIERSLDAVNCTDRTKHRFDPTETPASSSDPTDWAACQQDRVVGGCALPLPPLLLLLLADQSIGVRPSVRSPFYNVR
jgi:hypothetical protein